MARQGALRIEGTWLRSRLARRFFLMFCAMAFVPAAMVFWLTWRQADQAIEAAAQRNVRAETRFVAFTLLGRLQSAEALLASMAAAGLPANADGRVFAAVSRRPVDPGADLATMPRLRVRGNSAGGSPHVVLLAPGADRAGRRVVYAGTIAPGYLWRPDEDVVEGTRVCVRSGGRLLGCAGAVAEDARIVHGRWELDLHSALGAPSWQLHAERERRATPRLQLYWFALIAGGVLLMAVLMSLVQIRRMLVPLEALMDRIRLFSGSRPAAGPPRARDELAALSATFDEMRERIGGQLARLRGLSAVDAGIVSRAPLDDILRDVATQLRALPGIVDAAVAVARPGDAGQDVHCACEGADALDADGVRRVLAAPAGANVDGCWTDASAAPAGVQDRLYRLAIGSATPPVASVVVRARTDPPLDAETLDAARQLADRVAIALALDARERRLVHQSRHDALTGLPNRLAATEALDAAIAAAAGPFAVVFLDLDRFKSVNDGLGHAQGDDLLVEVARRLRQALDPDDLLARFGGDEFVLLLRGVVDAAALDRARARIAAAFAAPVLLGGHVIAIRHSAGVAFHPADGDTAQDLIRRADVAMYRAKQDGGGRFAVYSPAMGEAARDEVELVAALRAALEADALDVHFQPRIEASSGAWEGMEALVRWHDPARGWIPPARFVPLAERNGLIDALGAFVLRAACRHLRHWRALGLEPGRVAVNVSSEQLRSGRLIEEMARVLDDTGARWTDLEVEITESLLIADVATSAAQLQALRDRGVTVAIDDFGTGYSSLAYLARLPLDTIKIDRAFVVALDEPGTAQVIRSVLALASAMGKRVVTEGVETPAQLQVLRDWGCEVFQGYLFHRPMPAADIQQLLQAAAAGAEVD